MKEQVENEIFWQIFENQLNNDNYSFTYDSEEIWLDVPNYQGLYLISNYGRLKSLRKNRILNPSKDKDGYLITKLCKNKQCKNVKIHQLVAVAFLNHTPNRFELVVNHKDSNKLNNKLENLEIVTHRQNTSIERVIKKNNRSNFSENMDVGVSYYKNYKKFRLQARIIKGKNSGFGYYKNIKNANIASNLVHKMINKNYDEKKIKLILKRFRKLYKIN